MIANLQEKEPSCFHKQKREGSTLTSMHCISEYCHEKSQIPLHYRIILNR